MSDPVLNERWQFGTISFLVVIHVTCVNEGGTGAEEYQCVTTFEPSEICF